MYLVFVVHTCLSLDFVGQIGLLCVIDVFIFYPGFSRVEQELVWARSVQMLTESYEE
jgi:hypothetical protein